MIGRTYWKICSRLQSNKTGITGPGQEILLNTFISSAALYSGALSFEGNALFC